jgi:hypothetical protein
MSGDTFHQEILDQMDGIRSSHSPVGRADTLLAILGGDTTLLKSLSRDGKIKATFPRQIQSRRPITADALALISDVYFTHKKEISKDIQVLVYALSIDEHWRACLSSRYSANALVRNAMTVGFNALAGRHTGQVALDIFTAWLGPSSGPFILTPKFGESRLLQEKIMTALFGGHWWMFHAPEGDELLKLDEIGIWPDFVPGILPVQCCAPDADLPEISQ